MKLNQKTIAELAELLENAELQAHDVVKITDAHPEMDWDDAYAIQRGIRARQQARGVSMAGYKAGLTSHAKMEQMGVEEPVFGFITDVGEIPDGGTIDTATLIHPKVEAEIAFVLKDELTGPGCDIDAVLAATAYVVPALEVIDSRYKDFRFDLKSVIADNTSSARWISGGEKVPVAGLDLPNLAIVMEKNGEVVEAATGAAVLGHPAQSVAMLANMLARRGESLPAGAFIMTGGATAAVAVAPGDTITVKYQALGTISVKVV